MKNPYKINRILILILILFVSNQVEAQIKINYSCRGVLQTFSESQTANQETSQLSDGAYSNIFTPENLETKYNHGYINGLYSIHSMPGYIWTGTISADWTVPGNWFMNQVPSGGYPASIPAGTPFQPHVTSNPGTPASCNSLSIASGATLTIDEGKALTINGILTNPGGSTGLIVKSGGSLILNTSGIAASVDRNITSGANVWHLFITPITQSISASTTSCFNTAYLDRYNEPSGAWVRLLTDDIVLPNTGYSIFFPSGVQSLHFTGTLKSSPVVNSNLSYSAGAPGYLSGWNLVGNPYPCGINPALCSVAGGLNSFAYVWNGANYTTFSLGNTDFPGIIPSLQGFFVRTTSATNSLTLANTAKTHSGSFQKNGVKGKEMLKLSVDGNGYSDETYIRFNEAATSGFDQELDAYKLFGIEDAPQLYSMIALDNASVNTLPGINSNYDVPLGFKAGAENTYTITATGIDSFDVTTPVLIEDMKTNSTQDLRLNPLFQFIASPGDMEHRFTLHFKNSNGIGETKSGMVGIYSNRHTVYVSNPDNLQGSMYVYDLTGRLLSSTEMTRNSTDKIDMTGYSGSLLVKVITEKGITTGKVFVN